MKQKYNRRPNKNIFFSIMKGKNSIESIKTLLKFFLDQINTMEIYLKNKKYGNNFFLNEYYIYFYIIIDNLISWNSDVRNELFNMVHGKNCNTTTHTNAKIMLKKTFELYHILLAIVLFKPFMDEDWETNWS